MVNSEGKIALLSNAGKKAGLSREEGKGGRTNSVDSRRGSRDGGGRCTAIGFTEREERGPIPMLKKKKEEREEKKRKPAASPTGVQANDCE